MKSFKALTIGAALALSLVGASSASAATWDPQNSIVTGTAVGTTTLDDSSGNTVSCSVGDVRIHAFGDRAVATGPNDPVNWSSCTASFLGGLAATVTTTGTWTFTATSQTSVDITALPGTGGSVADINIPVLGQNCSIKVTGPVSIPGNTWSNATHRLTVNPAGTFELDQSAACLGLVGSTGRLTSTFSFPANVVIT